jgi:hypothetical protein
MKNLKFVSAITILLFLIVNYSNAQTSSDSQKKLLWGVKLGLGMSSFHSNNSYENLGYIPGASLGAFARVGRTKHRGQVELLLSSRGASTKVSSDNRRRTLNLDLPLIYNIKLSSKIYAEIGLQTSLYLGNLKFGSYTKNPYSIYYENYLFTGFNKIDEFVLLGAGLEFKKIEIGIRGLYGFAKNNKFDPSYYHVVDTTDPIYQSLINHKLSLHSMSFNVTIGYKF